MCCVLGGAAVASVVLSSSDHLQPPPQGASICDDVGQAFDALAVPFEVFGLPGIVCWSTALAGLATGGTYAVIEKLSFR